MQREQYTKLLTFSIDEALTHALKTLEWDCLLLIDKQEKLIF